MSKGDFVLLSELDGYSSDRLSWRVGLPEYVPADEIGLNVSRVEKLARIAGLGHLRIETEAGDATEYHASVIGSDSQGNAVAGMSAVESKASLENTSIHNPNDIPDPYYEYSWGDGKISVNATELNDRIIRGRIDNGSLRSSRAWSHQLDRAVRAGIRQSANEQLISNVPLYKVLMQSALMVTGVGYAIRNGHANPIGLAGEVGFNWELYNLSNTFVASIMGLHPRERRLSLIPGHQVDRLAVVHGLTRASKVIKKVR